MAAKMAAATRRHFDLFVIGGGSGGLACARRAATYNVRVGLADGNRLGGTCVNVGCVPKKVMWCVASVHETLHELKNFAFTVKEQPTFCWRTLKTNRDNYIKRLNNIYLNNLKNSGVTFFPAYARFAKPEAKTDGGLAHAIVLKSADGNEETVTADHVLIASGGRPAKAGIEGEEHTINSDGFFELEEMPQKVALLGAGYIAVEFAGVFAAMKCETHLFVRHERALRKFDDMISMRVDEFMRKAGVQIHPHSVAKAVRQEADKSLTLELTNGESFRGFDSVIVSVGRVPEVANLGLDVVGVKQRHGGYIVADEFQNTSVEQIYAVGDVSGKIELTPVAIAAGRRLADRLFGGLCNAKLDSACVPTVVFSHPPAACVGLTEAEAKATYGEKDIKVYTGTSVNLYYGAWPVAPEEKPKTFIKMICVKSQMLKVVGLHVVGMGADEMIQGFGVAMKMGATKADFDNCVAVHPTAAEEVVTLPPWGLSHKDL
ncbi:glutathione reductase [Toxoplasma gondii TgCatPRC2]|uniref:Glutathione reductase n=15 Tax=Toxoplasma gondii TaxID=5811 RepID=A0A125YVR9_TOXGV|nr:glutathione reductase [Toxoplasma gondii ME49]ESS34173.1 glutathione reductase [Toxoplasma gondii VEG]KFG46859.1 glutathione reductase [Toxoplasma gondii GAB2-2007-GAL-DOM2]KFH12396.1 glutathione reductase [Toxoplasma gondii VAND]KYK68322.1 glutathione reductase [Toxoplasma gondii TgCatPRC2]PIM04719.1 glutathione reductase [Toxoplasma gondii COUG]PUA90544.1 glutathione reductase [Toxoplasma gondii TgCATBr9]|eukprot:XP_018634939.1 glutathione reductase [Toxoplasma gondii ME49]